MCDIHDHYIKYVTKSKDTQIGNMILGFVPHDAKKFGSLFFHAHFRN